MSLIKAVLFSEFDNVLGPKITLQIPNNILSIEQFDTVSDYIIPSVELSNKYVILNIYNYKIISYPIHIINSIYYRNAYIFNICFILSNNNSDIYPFLPLLIKLTNAFKTLEMESKFISSNNNNNIIKNMMIQIYKDLNNSGECILFIDSLHSINLKLFPSSNLPPDIMDFQVPLHIMDLESNITETWDITLKEILPYIDGIRHVKRISIESGVDIELVRSCIRQLIFFRCITLIDIIQFSSIYTVTSKIDELARDPNMQKECMEFIFQPDTLPKTNLNTPSLSPILNINFPTIFTLYCNLNRMEFAHFWNLYKPSFDPLRFLLFGLMNKIIRKVERYPLKGDKIGDFGDKWSSLLNKSSGFIEMQCELNVNHTQLALTLQKHTDSVVILK